MKRNEHISNKPDPTVIDARAALNVLKKSALLNKGGLSENVVHQRTGLRLGIIINGYSKMFSLLNVESQ